MISKWFSSKFCSLLACGTLLAFIPVDSSASNRHLIVDLSRLDCSEGAFKGPVNVQVIDKLTRIKGKITNSEKYNSKISFDNESAGGQDGNVCLLSGVASDGGLLSGILYRKNNVVRFKLTTKAKRGRRVDTLVDLKTDKVREGVANYPQFKVSAAPKSILNHKNCNETAELSGTDSSGSNTAVTQNTAAKLEADPAYSVIVAAEGDSRFAGSVSDPAQEMIRQINDISVLYKAQLNIKLIPGQIKVYTSQLTDPYYRSGRTSSENLLTKFYQSRSVSGAGTYHLFTGNDLGPVDLGISYLQNVCTLYSLGLSKYVGGNVQKLIVAHEVGHNFGASHDSSSVPSLMSAQLDEKLDINTLLFFSEFSRNEIRSYLKKQVPLARACFNVEPSGSTPVTPVTTPSAQPPTNPVLKKAPLVSISISLTRKGKLTVRYSTSKIAPQCRTSVYTSVDREAIILPENLVTEITLDEKRTKTVTTFNNRTEVPVFVRHQTVCPDLPKRTSGIRKVRADRVLSESLVDIQEWKKVIKQALE